MRTRFGQGRLIVLAGGGTGGHLTPGLAVAEALLARGVVARVQLFGTGRPVETAFLTEACSRAIVEHVAVPAMPLTQLRRRPLRFVWNNARAVRLTLRRFRTDPPAAVIGLGGFASAPVVLAARRLKIPVVLLEQNLLAGRATRWLSRLAQRVCVSFEETRFQLPPSGRAVLTGNPVRRSVRQAAIKQTGGFADEDSPRADGLRVMVLGGSQGAAALNSAVPEALKAVRDRVTELHVVHQAGAQQAEQVQRAYAQVGIEAVVRPFFADLPGWLARSDLAVSRAGATTLAELACLQTPAILVPYPYAAENHQRSNAQFFAQAGAAAMVCQSEDDRWIAALSEHLTRLLTDPLQRRRMARAMAELARPDAADRVAEQIERLIGHAPHADLPRRPHRLRSAPPEPRAAALFDRHAD